MYKVDRYNTYADQDLLCCLEQFVEYATILESSVHSSINEHYQELLIELLTSLDVILRCIEEERDERIREVLKGRPVIEIQQDQLRFYVDSGFKVRDIALLLGCSERTMERRMNTWQLSARNYTIISDSELDEHVIELCTSYPRCGKKLVDGRLRAKGIRIQRQRVRDSLRRVDPSGIDSRMRSVLHRREYYVKSPNSLWHIDGHHKLIRWKIVIHGGIDGYSRLITFLQASSNNRAETVLSAFLKAVDEFGLPSRIRTDKGGENVLIAHYMNSHPERGPGRGSIIAGKSIHNQRIERLWRDLFSGCICFFYYFFYFLEDTGILNIEDQLDLYALHHAFIPVIQKQLDIFMQAWGSHPLRTERNQSPKQLWILGMHAMCAENHEDSAVTGMYLVSRKC